MLFRINVLSKELQNVSIDIKINLDHLKNYSIISDATSIAESVDMNIAFPETLYNIFSTNTSCNFNSLQDQCKNLQEKLIN